MHRSPSAYLSSPVVGVDQIVVVLVVAPSTVIVPISAS